MQKALEAGYTNQSVTAMKKNIVLSVTWKSTGTSGLSGHTGSCNIYWIPDSCDLYAYALSIDLL